MCAQLLVFTLFCASNISRSLFFSLSKMCGRMRAPWDLRNGWRRNDEDDSQQGNRTQKEIPWTIWFGGGYIVIVYVVGVVGVEKELYSSIDRTNCQRPNGLDGARPTDRQNLFPLSLLDENRSTAESLLFPSALADKAVRKGRKASSRASEMASKVPGPC